MNDELFADVTPHVVEVTTHDQDDIVIGRQYMMLFLDDATDDQLLASSVTTDL